MIIDIKQSDRILEGTEAALLKDVVNIAERALWDPAKVSLHEIQILAASVVAHVLRHTGGVADGENRHRLAECDAVEGSGG